MTAEEPKYQYRQLIPGRIAEELTVLTRRIDERFPESGLGRVARELLAVARESTERSRQIGRPIRLLRLVNFALLALIALGIFGTLYTVEMPEQEPLTFLEFIQVLEAAINDVILIGAGIFFLFTFERRIKRHRALQAIHELRSIAHVIDMHQLNKDPEHLRMNHLRTASSPVMDLTLFQINRYLDYCSEMLALTGKIAALYVQNFDDEVALAAVNEVESLTTGLSRKIWQKLMIINQMEAEAARQQAGRGARTRRRAKTKKKKSA